MNYKYWIAFSSIEQIDSRFIKRLYDYFGDIEKAFNCSLEDLKNIDGLSIKKAQNFIQCRDKIDIDKVFATVETKGINFLTLEDENYPYMLKNIENPPVVLYYKGKLFECNLGKTLAVVGSRKASSGARDNLRKIISGLGNTDICIVSGLASGIDTVAHASAIENNLKTIGVIASGFDYVYPSQNKTLYENIENGYGAVVTEYYPTFEPIKFRFPQRNRIVSGLSYGTLVVEASLRSGALITANLTLEQGRELMCMPGDISNPNTQGIYKLLKNGATMVTEGNDILDALGWERTEDNPTQLTLPTLTPDEEKIYNNIKIEERGIDELSTLTGLSLDNLLMNLTTMELKGMIKQVNGDRYRAV
ncbi:MAG: DNA-processing protein DprA [Cyanobacteriota bacterium]|nr:DNA-processing protein DprA [Cyanobacteriota bacterium]MDY6357896.1 DNA-processing protein DprA [Cyanobacteriota bacterium]MDY6363273.1 DNA-processing protein DprA [Cyanobacteriota bacterium]MDY6383786.1 DNA-processing protein DprA [Cyanobacteriota bacterium]